MGLTDLEIEDLILSILHQTKRILVGREKPKSNMRVSLCLQPLVGYFQNYLTIISLHNLVSNPFSVCLIRFHPSSTVVWKELIPCSLWAQSVLRLHWNSLRLRTTSSRENLANSTSIRCVWVGKMRKNNST